MTKICGDDITPDDVAVPPPPPSRRDEWKVSRTDVLPVSGESAWTPVGEGTWGIVYKEQVEISFR